MCAYTREINKNQTIRIMKKKETIRSLWTPTAGMLTGARRVAMLLLTTLLLTMTAQKAWAQTFNVSFNKCGGQGGPDNVEATYGLPMPPITMPTREGYTFGGYFTKEYGRGTQYYKADGTSARDWDINNDATLYAMWTTDRIYINVLFTFGDQGNLDDETLARYENGGLSVTVNGQSVSREGNSIYYTATSLAGQKNTISVELPDYLYVSNATYNYTGSDNSPVENVPMTYEGSEYKWSFTIAEDAISSQERNVGITINIGDVHSKYIVFFDANGGTGAMEYLIMDPSSTQNLPTCTFSRDGYTFKGWATSASGSRQYDDGAEITAGDTGGTLTLYAKWSNNEAPEDETYTVTFDANGGTGDDMSPQTFTVDVAQNLSACSYTREGYTFDGWSTTQNGDVAYTDEQEVSGLASEGVTVMLYAHWKANTYYVQFNGNGNTSGLMERESFTYDAPAKKLTANAFTREGYAFSGWNTAADGSGSSYENEAEVNNLTSEADGIVELYAQWKKQLTNDNITIEIPAQTYNGSELTPVVTVYDNDSEVSDEHYTVTLPEGRTNAGDYLITITAKEGSTIYTGSKTAKFTISKAPLTVTANDRSIFYGNAAANDGVTYNGFVNNEDENVLGGELTYAYSNAKGSYGANNDAPGEYDITPDGLTSGNYAITFVPGKLTVDPVIVRVSVVDKGNGQPIVGLGVVVMIKSNTETNGKIIHNWYSTTENHEISVLKAGGEYTIMGNAFMGYTSSAEYTFTIGEDGNVTSSGSVTEDGVLLVENSKTHVEISVVDKVTRAALGGARVQVKDSEGKVVEEWVSVSETENNEINHIIEGLTIYEEYTLCETVAPNGYAAPAAYTFKIDIDGKVTTTDGTTTTEEGNTVLVLENPFTVPLFAANSSNLWMTWCDKYDYVKPEGVTVYTVSGVENNTVTLGEVSDVIPAYTPVLLYREAAGDDVVTATFSAVGTAPASGYDSSSGIVEANLSDNVTLYGNSGDGAYASGSDNNIFAISDLSDIQSYVLLDGQFVLVDYDEGISAHRCWLNVTKSTTNGARMLSIDTDSESTGIETTNFTNSANPSGAWYGIDGRKLDGKPTKKGLYIYNGKKQVIK